MGEYVLIFHDCREVTSFSCDLMPTLDVLQTSYWSRCVVVGREGLLADLNIVGIALKCHKTE